MNKDFSGFVSIKIVTVLAVLSLTFMPAVSVFADDVATDTPVSITASTTDTTNGVITSVSTSSIDTTMSTSSDSTNISFTLSSSHEDNNHGDHNDRNHDYGWNQKNGDGWDGHECHFNVDWHNDWDWYNNHCKHNDGHGGNGDHGHDHDGDCDNGGNDNGGGDNGGGTGTTTSPIATTTLTVNVSTDSNGPAELSDFNLNITTASSTVFSGVATSSQIFVLNQNDVFSVNEITGTTSANYLVSFTGACSGTVGTNPLTCGISNTYLGTTTGTTTGGNNNGGGNGGTGTTTDNGGDSGSTGGSSSGGGSSVGGGSSSSSTGYSGGGILYTTPVGTTTGQVLGANVGPDSTTCPILGGYIKFGANNNITDVVFLQRFLNQNMNAGLPITGVYNTATLAAVNAFQVKYNTLALKPWSDIGLLPNDTTPTGYVFKTTRWTINNIACPTLQAAMPLLP